MAMVQQNPDGLVIVRDNGGNVYIDTAANFAKDFAVGAPVLPAGANSRIYDQSVRHACTDGETIVSDNVSAPMPWPAGDAYINNILTALAAQKARQPASVAPPGHPRQPASS